MTPRPSTSTLFPYTTLFRSQSDLHLSNSSVIRYAQLFDPIKSVSYFCNRGTSGIDGSTSTAIGNAIVGENKLHTFITGDISFFYDSNAFWNHHVPSNFRVFLINKIGRASCRERL